MRVTKRDGGGNAVMDCDNCEIKYRESCCSLYLCRNALINKLAAYEDTGLEPEEIKENIGLLSPICIGCDGKTADGKRTEKCTYVDDDFRKCLERSVHLSELAHAEEQGLLIRLPCKVGDTVYVLTGRGFIAKGELRSFRLFDKLVADVEYHHFGTYATSRYWGESVFLTRAEAEAALKDGDGE